MLMILQILCQNCRNEALSQSNTLTWHFQHHQLTVFLKLNQFFLFKQSTFKSFLHLEGVTIIGRSYKANAVLLSNK